MRLASNTEKVLEDSLMRASRFAVFFMLIPLITGIARADSPEEIVIESAIGHCYDEYHRLVEVRGKLDDPSTIHAWIETGGQFSPFEMELVEYIPRGENEVPARAFYQPSGAGVCGGPIATYRITLLRLSNDQNQGATNSNDKNNDVATLEGEVRSAQFRNSIDVTFPPRVNTLPREHFDTDPSRSFPLQLEPGETWNTHKYCNKGEQAIGHGHRIAHTSNQGIVLSEALMEVVEEPSGSDLFRWRVRFTLENITQNTVSANITLQTVCLRLGNRF